jgi:drug/metabolite transporter (DMT)-like permease
MAIWGSSFVVTTLVLDEAGPFAVTLLRFGLGLLVLLPFAYRRGFRFRLVLEPAFLLFGLTGVALVYGLQTLALVFTSAANTALISAGVPVVAAVLARAFLKEAIPPARLFGIGLSVLGIGLVTGAAEGSLREVGAPVYHYYLPDPSLKERAVAEARAALGDAAFEEARERGREMSFEQAVAFALSESDAPEEPTP